MIMARAYFPLSVLTTALLLAVVSAYAPAAERRRSTLANIDLGANESASAAARPAEQITFAVDGKQQTVTGRILIEARDGGVLLESPDGAQYTIEGHTVLAREESNAPFRPFTPAELGDELLTKLPPGFRVHTTPHYVVCYNTSREYAEWTSSLFERLYKAFTSYWKRQGMDVEEPEFPLVVIAYADRGSYEAAAKEVLGDGARGVVGYYNLKTNWVNMYDLTGTESLRAQNTGRQAGATANRRGSQREITQMLSQRSAVPLVSTIVHEATHQIAFNCGLQTRLSDIPLWLCEGMAVYFEAPDLASSRGWRGIGRVNYARLETFRRNLPNWRRDSLTTLIADNHRFRDPQTAIAAYADAWALNYYLIKYHPKDYAAYLQHLADKPPLIEDDADTHLAEFKQHFGDLKTLERDFFQKMSRVE
jgi:hypothetical protein